MPASPLRDHSWRPHPCDDSPREAASRGRRPACSMKVGDVEFSRRNGVHQICIPVRWEIGSTVIEVKFCYEIPLPI